MPDRMIAHISDTHLGYRFHFRRDASGRNIRSVDIEDAYRKVVDDILDFGPVDLIVHTGDVFHQSSPSWSAIRCFIVQTRRLEQLGCPIIVIAGNHDTPQLRTSNTVFSILELSLPGVRFVAGYVEEEFDLPELGIHLVAVPHGRLISGPIKDVLIAPNRANILITHGMAPSMPEQVRHEIGETFLDAELLSPGFDAILLGHFHEHHKVSSNTWYAGSTERIGWNDEQHRPGWAVVRLDDNGNVDVQQRTIDVRQMITLGAYDGEAQTARQIATGVLDAARRFARPDAIARIELQNVDRSERKSAESIIRREVGEQYLALQTFSRQDASALFNEDVQIDPSLRMKGLGDLFVDFVAEQDYDAGFRDRFLERGRNALETAVRNLEPSTGDPE